MRIAIFSDTFSPQVNGVSNTLNHMRAYMDAHGISYRFFVPGSGDMNTLSDPDIIRYDGFKLFLYPECRIAMPQYHEVCTQMDAFKPEIIHLVTPFSMGLMGLRYARATGIPLVASYHTNFPEYMRYYHFPILETPAWWYMRWFHSFSAVNLVPSRDTLLHLEKHKFSRLSIWGRGIDCTLFSPKMRDMSIREKYGIGHETLLIYVGRLAPEKEIPVLLKAVERLNQKGLQFSLLLVGEGPERQALEGWGLPNVRFVGYQSGHALRALYASADIFVFPSPSETYGNVLLEAMASGLPVVSVYGGGVKDNLIHRYNGLSVECGNDLEMSKAVARLILNQSLRKQLATGARSHAHSRSWDWVFMELFECYDRIVEGRMGNPTETSAS